MLEKGRIASLISRLLANPVGLRLITAIQLLRDLPALRKVGLTAPLPGFLKRGVIRRRILEFKPDVFLETGTYLGQMASCAARLVKSVVTIEVSEALAIDARRRLRNQPNVNVLTGDSARLLPDVIKQISPESRVMFWLDGHFSGGVTSRGDIDCPLMAELEAISAASFSNIEILIDDVRCLIGRDGYPLISEVVQQCNNVFPGKRIVIENDILFVR